MPKTFSLIKREYLSRVRTKGFIIGTLLLPVFIVGVTFVPTLVARKNAPSGHSIAVIDMSGRLYAAISQVYAQDKNKGDQIREIKTGEAELQKTIGLVNTDIKNDKLDALVVLPADIFSTNQFSMYSRNVTNFRFNESLENKVSKIIVQMRLEESGIDADLVKKLSREVQLKTFKVDKMGAKEESGMAAFGVSYVMVFILYMALLLYGTFVMRGVTEDKTSRVVEVLLSSAKPEQLMAGKIMGIGAAGLTQFFIWMLAMLLASSFGIILARQYSPEISQIALPTIAPGVYVAFLVFFVLGYFLYATLYAMVGSIVNSDTDAQSLQWPVTMFIIVALMFMFPIINNPNSNLALIMSMIPFFSPLLMFLRYSVGAAPVWQVLVSIVLLAVTIWGLIWLTGRIFRIGILMYGKRPTLPEVIKWMRYS